MSESALPSGWREVNDTDRDAGRYNPQPISRYEHTETGVGIQLTPADPGRRSGGGGDGEGDEEGGYRVSVGADGPDDPSGMAALDGASDHADALGVAREFMKTHNERCVGGGEDLDSVLADHG